MWLNEVNPVVRFEKGKKKGFVAYNDNGKIILSRNDVRTGYYKIDNIEEKEKTILVDAERISYDYFPGINYLDFLEVLKYNGFKIGFIEDFHYKCGEYDHLIFAYDMETHIVIVAETWDSGKCFNKIEVYCPGMNCFHVKNRMFSHGSSSISVFNLVHSDVFNKNLGAIHMIKTNMQDIVENGNNIYKDNDNINLWNSSEHMKNSKNFEEQRKKIKRANREDMIELFSKNETMMKALNG